MLCRAVQVSYAVYQAAEEAAAGGSRGRKRTAEDAVKPGEALDSRNLVDIF
jgi:hypothetical protein